MGRNNRNNRPNHPNGGGAVSGAELAQQSEDAIAEEEKKLVEGSGTPEAEADDEAPAEAEAESEAEDEAEAEPEAEAETSDGKKGKVKMVKVILQQPFYDGDTFYQAKDGEEEDIVHTFPSDKVLPSTATIIKS